MQCLLASTVPSDLSKLKFPVYVSPKLDGIRILITPDGPRTRKMEEIPNPYIRAALSKLPPGLDGEVTVGATTGDDVWNRTQSALMDEDPTLEPLFTFHVFDDFSNPDEPFQKRIYQVQERLRLVPDPRVVFLPHIPVSDVESLHHFERTYVRQKFEGMMLRSANGKYKFGRSTEREQILMKWKRWDDSEAVIIDMKELHKNENEKTKDKTGKAKRATKKEGKVPMGTLGAFICQWGDVEFDLGSGFDAATRDAFWKNPPIGQVVKFKHQGITTKKKPRFPIYLGLRDKRDMS